MRLAMRRPKRTLGHRNTAELALETNREKNEGGRDGWREEAWQGGRDGEKQISDII